MTGEKHKLLRTVAVLLKCEFADIARLDMLPNYALRTLIELIRKRLNEK